MFIKNALTESIKMLAERTGVVIPVYFPPAVDSSLSEHLVMDNLSLLLREISSPTHIVLSLDGEENGLDIVQRIAVATGVSYCVGKVNRGKFQGIVHGAAHLLQNCDLEYLAVVDSDGDHFGNELLNFIRCSRHMAEQTGNKENLVIGRRISKHRPMGFLRGELEELADRILLDALNYHAVIQGKPLHWEYCNALEEYPDFHSGYKLFTKKLAEKILLGEHFRAGVSEDCYYRHAMEAVMSVEALENGGLIGCVNRSTFNEQPMTTFGSIGREQFIADKIIWPCKRLSIPFSFVEQWFTNHAHRLLMHTMQPYGRDELNGIKKILYREFGAEDVWQPLSQQPLFV